MTEEAKTVEAPKAKPKRKYKRHAAAKPKVAAPPEFEGITPTDCCSGCGPDKCVITGIALCGHPFKGGLQPALMGKPDVVARFTRVKKALAHQKIDLMGA